MLCRPTMHSDDDVQFPDRLRRAQGGEPAAFDALVRWVEGPLMGFLRAQGASDPAGSANEVLVRVFSGIGRFEGNAAQFRAWVFQIARNLVIDEHRASGRRPVGLSTAPERLPEDRAALEVDRLDELERVEALLVGLTADQREVLLLRVVAGLSVEETAEVVGRRPGAVRALQHRALNQLRSKLSRNP
jgi:RNA polymerase sigma factor (sigma-70 family)